MTGRPADPGLDADLATLREPGVFNWSARKRGLAALARVEAELSRLREQVKFCPYCAGAFVPETKGYEGPCPGCQRAEAAEARCARLQQAYDRAEDERLQLRAAFYRLQDQLGRAYECCARPSGTCFDPEVLTTSVPGSSAADVDGSEKRESAARAGANSPGSRRVLAEDCQSATSRLRGRARCRFACRAGGPVSVHIKCDRCGAMDDLHWRNLHVEIRRGAYASTTAPEYTPPYDLDVHICGYCAATLRGWWNNREGK